MLPFAQSSAHAEEVVQDVLFKIWSRRETLVGILSLEKYLLRMAKNQLLDHLKKQAIEQKYRNRLEVADRAPANGEEELLLKEYHQLAQDAIGKLPDKQREVFLLRHRHDLTLDEIARSTGSSRAAVQKNLVRATRFIRDYLRDAGEWAFPMVCLLLAAAHEL